MSDTSMLRVRGDLKNQLKAKAKAEGRTLEFETNRAIERYLNPDYAEAQDAAKSFMEPFYTKDDSQV